MDSSLAVAVIASSTAVAVSAVGFVLNLSVASRARRTQTLDIAAQYRDPLLWAANDLRSRLYNIGTQDFLKSSREAGETEWRYAQHSTLFVVAEYLGWVEVLRLGVQFLDLGDRKRNQRLVNLLHAIERAFASSKIEGTGLRLLRAEQRAVGELMITVGTHGDMRECLGYATFCARLEQDDTFRSWFSRLVTGIDELSERQDMPTRRLVELQNRVTDLIEFLDPDAVRIPSRRRDRLAAPPD
jgi:hypothetical protein